MNVIYVQVHASHMIYHLTYLGKSELVLSCVALNRLKTVAINRIHFQFASCVQKVDISSDEDDCDLHACRSVATGHHVHMALYHVGTI